MLQKLSSAAVVIGSLKVNPFSLIDSHIHYKDGQWMSLSIIYFESISCFCCRLLIFFKVIFFEKCSTNTIRVSPDLGPNRL